MQPREHVVAETPGCVRCVQAFSPAASAVAARMHQFPDFRVVIVLENYILILKEGGVAQLLSVDL